MYGVKFIPLSAKEQKRRAKAEAKARRKALKELKKSWLK
jgi:hypothetical protein